jgi:HlyD family secretion protein
MLVAACPLLFEQDQRAVGCLRQNVSTAESFRSPSIIYRLRRALRRIVSSQGGGVVIWWKEGVMNDPAMKQVSTMQASQERPKHSIKPAQGGMVWRVIGGLLGALLLFWAGARAWQGPQLAAQEVVRRDFVQTVVATGHVESPHRVDIGAQVNGYVRRVPVDEGQVVRQGQLLIELDSAELGSAERTASAAVTQAQAHLRQIDELALPVARHALEQAKATAANAESTLRRNQDLATKGFMSAAALDDAVKAVELARAQVGIAQKQLDAELAAGSDREQAEAALKQSQAALETARARTAFTRIVAPVEGVLIARSVEQGDVVSPGKALMTLSPSGHTQLVVDIDEKNLRLLKLGQLATASADAYARERFDARVAYINPGINAQTGAVNVKLDVDTPPAYLRQDMTVSVDILVARRPKALLVPVSSVHDAGAAHPWVWRVEAGRAMHRDVGLGVQSGGFAEVLSGLGEGDLILGADADIKAGDRVRTVLK